jgi:hypothetical protein
VWRAHSGSLSLSRRVEMDGFLFSHLTEKNNQTDEIHIGLIVFVRQT